MARIRPRPPTWVDGLILVAGLVVALAVAVLHDLSSYWPLTLYYVGPRVAWPSLPWWFQAMHLPAKRVQSDFVAFLDLMSIAVAIVLFRRPPWRFPVLPAPGIAATAAATGAILLGKGSFLLRSTFDLGLNLRRSVAALNAYQSEFVPSAESVTVAGAVLGVWIYLALARASKARDDWRDWLGRWLGWAWISAVVFRTLVFTLWG